jgi:hypothetical protein
MFKVQKINKRNQGHNNGPLISTPLANQHHGLAMSWTYFFKSKELDLMLQIIKISTAKEVLF